MIDGQNISSIIEKMKKLHINDPAIYKYWDQLILEFNDVNDTICFLDGCTEEEIGWLSSVFDDLAYKFQSKGYAECLKRLDEKYPDNVLSNLVELAESCID
ncbi:hypothetical protein [Lysinibacillus fusiformis]|uniref:hypothetical protein n=1 Tax=Lysinibacillus fusiformis TaxID=28031 RepID=UPI001966EE3B|nr:hypothetical protein [Lysinibacillus fusiformis]QSB09317.1 hypothetical protein JTI58_20275 [Lysinibacillus fusiformis]UXJ70924.1 hypothetical protein N5069_10410 [Lysinibacillus fusiformis]